MTNDFTHMCEPFALFADWLKDATESELNDPNAMTLASVDAHGLPDARMVLLKDADARGFVFYTNLYSAKGEELAQSGKAALLFHWKSRRRQVRVRGTVENVSAAEADAYFATRPRISRIGAWASHQSRPLESRAVLEAAVANFEQLYPSADVPRPPHWSGFRVVPQQIEFWQDGAFRLHDRIVFSRATPQAEWQKQRLYP